MKASTIPQIQQASTADKLELIDDLWASIPPSEVAPLDSHLAELDKRLKAYAENPNGALDADSARARLRKITGL